MILPLMYSVTERLSGEKLNNGGPPSQSLGGRKTSSSPRAVASSNCTIFNSNLATAMNLLHGDHATARTLLSQYMVATVGSHEVGSPQTTFAKGRAYCLYRSRTIDVRGDTGNAE